MKVFRDYVDGGMALSSLRDALKLRTSQFEEDKSTYRWHEDAMFLTWEEPRSPLQGVWSEWH